MTYLAPKGVTLQRAVNFLAADALFRNTTGCDTDKATEIVAAAIVNEWLAQHNYAWQIEVSSSPRGIDGQTVGLASTRSAVEIKSSKQKSAEFQFASDFPFLDHACVVMATFDMGVPVQIFFAFGEKALDELRKMLHIDTLRPTFKPARGDRARLFANAVPKASKATFDAHAPLSRTLKEATLKTWSVSDAIIEINQPEIANLMASSHPQPTVSHPEPVPECVPDLQGVA